MQIVLPLQNRSIASSHHTYKVLNGKYPDSLVSNGDLCLTVDNDCTKYDGTVITTSNAALISDLKTVGSPPSSSFKTGQSGTHGLTWDYAGGNYRASINGEVVPGILQYWLEGNNQDCKVNVFRIVYEGGTGGYGASASVPNWSNLGNNGSIQLIDNSQRGYTYYQDGSYTPPSGVTMCYVSV